MTADKRLPLVPKLRFPEFGNMPEWELTQLSDVLDYEQPGKYIVENASYQNSGTPVLTANKSFVLGHTAETDGIYQNVPVIIFDDFTTDAKYVDFPFKVKSSAIKILTSRGEDELQLVYELMSRIRFDPTQHKRYFISQYQYLKIPLPDKPEQQKIADCLGSLDDLIAAEGRKLDALRQHKQGLMQKLFPQPGETQPRLRFPEFCSAGDWHFQPLRDIAEPISDKVGTSKCVPMSITTGVGLLSQEKKFDRTIAGNSYRNYTRLRTNDFAYNKSATKEFPQGYIARYSGTRDAAVPKSIFTCFRPDADAVIPEYLDHLFHGNHHGRWLRKYITVGARAHGALSVSDDALMSLPVPLPPVAVSRPEQQKIADCLSALDARIGAQLCKLEALKTHKQGLLQQPFPTLENQ